MTTIVLDSHVVHWWSAEPDRVSHAAATALSEADADHERITVTIPVRSWLERLAAQVRTLPLTPVVAATAVELPSTFPGDPADRLIYATAIEHGCRLVTKDRRLRRHRHPRPVTIW
jgi:PIN domain nuclease of toxin-antitoxin system